MRSPRTSTVDIECPHCRTRYRVPPETLGPDGRKVSCAHCGKAWLATPDRMFDRAEEERLDQVFTAEAEAALAGVPKSLRKLLPAGEVPPPEVLRSIAEIQAALQPRPPGVAEAPTAPPPDRAAKQLAQRSFTERHKNILHALPAARLRRAARGVSVGLLLGVVAGGLWFRVDIVRVMPDLAGVYAAIGLPVNVVGLVFTDTTTLLSRRGTSDILEVTTTIRGLENRTIPVPPVVVTLLDAADTPLYQWSVAPRQRELERGESVAVATELAGPPAGTTHVRLSFAQGAGRAESPLPTERP